MKSGPLTPARYAPFRRALLRHYDSFGRDLPWRNDTDPYRVMVSEFMLQQTRVETVLGYYGRWLQQFPTVGDLAAADEEDVLKAWEGLGYYRRARNLHRSARIVCETHDGRVPDRYSALLALPGMGAYTAGAVASIAFSEAVPAVDGNVRRVFARLFDRGDPTSAWLRERADALLDRDRPGDSNQALMELGATVCVPRRPGCDACPVALFCEARSAGTVDRRPAARPRKPVASATFVLCVLHRRGEVLLERRSDGGLLGGLWAFPEQRLDEGDPPAMTVAEGIAAELMGVAPSDSVPLSQVDHRFTHLHARYVPVAMSAPDGVDGWSDGGTAPSERPRTWTTPERALAQLALPVAQRKVLESWAGATP